jgi:hypothetical protein
MRDCKIRSFPPADLQREQRGVQLLRHERAVAAGVDAYHARVRTYRDRSLEKDWRFRVKLSRSGPDKSKRIAGFGCIVASETEAPNLFAHLV